MAGIGGGEAAKPQLAGLVEAKRVNGAPVTFVTSQQRSSQAP
jgi:hypothetical protein